MKMPCCKTSTKILVKDLAISVPYFFSIIFHADRKISTERQPHQWQLSAAYPADFAQVRAEKRLKIDGWMPPNLPEPLYDR